MITPVTMVANVVCKVTGWKPVICNHDEFIELVRRKFIEGQSKQYIESVYRASKGGFWKPFFLESPDGRYELYIEQVVSSKGRSVRIRDWEEKKIYEKDYLFLKKFAEAIWAECEKELKDSVEGVSVSEKKILNSDKLKRDMQFNNFCPQCGTRCIEGDLFCSQCGEKIV